MSYAIEMPVKNVYTLFPFRFFIERLIVRRLLKLFAYVFAM